MVFLIILILTSYYDFLEVNTKIKINKKRKHKKYLLNELKKINFYLKRSIK